MEVESLPAQTLCPSAQPDWDGAVTVGVVLGTAVEPHLVHLDHPLPVSRELLEITGPVAPTEVFRFAAPCLCSGCVHFEGARCQLATRVVKLLSPVAERIPSCPIRPNCRWWQQEGPAACLRCPQVVTDNYNPSNQMRAAAGTQSSVVH